SAALPLAHLRSRVQPSAPRRRRLGRERGTGQLHALPARPSPLLSVSMEDASDVAERVAAVVGRGVVSLSLIDRGHIANRRYIARLDDGTSVFVKEPTSPWTEAVLAEERQAYESIGPRPFLPA